MTQLLGCCVLSFILVFPVLARQSSDKAEAKDRVTKLLQSTSVKDRTWAAYLVGEYQLKEFAAALIDLLDPVLIDKSTEPGYLFMTALDSLIRLRIDVPTDKLMPFYKSYPDQVLILLAGSPDENKDLLLSLAKQGSNHWRVICNLLAEIKAPGLTAYLLSKLQVKIELALSEGARRGMGTGDGLSGGVGCGGGALGVPEDFPPIAYYELVNEPKTGGLMKTYGPYPVFYRRGIFYPGDKHYARVEFCGYNVNQKIREYLALMLNTTLSDVNIRDMYSYSISWSGTTRYLNDVVRFREEAIGDFSQLKNRLVEKGLLTSEESASLKINLHIIVHDLREDRSIGLPEIYGVKVD